MSFRSFVGFGALAAALGLAGNALTDEVGVAAKMVKVLEKPGKAVIRVVWKDATPGVVHKGPAGDPAALRGFFLLCMTETPGGFGSRTPAELATEGAWRANTGTLAKYTSKDDGLRRVVLETTGTARVVAKSDTNLVSFSGLTSVEPWPPGGGSVAFGVLNSIDGSMHRLCSDLSGAESVMAKDIASGAGRKIVWKGVPPDPACALYNDIRLTAGCSPSGAFLD